MTPGHTILWNIPNKHMAYTNMKEWKPNSIQYFSADETHNRDNYISDKLE